MDRLGLPAEIEWLAAEDLLIDPAYQRVIDEAHVQRLMDQFNPNGLAVFHVSKRLDGYYLIDGQHRIETIKRLDLGYLQVRCLVYEDLTRQEEEELFIMLNEGHLPVSAFHTFHTRIKAQNYDAGAVARTLEQCGIRLVPSGANLRANEVSAITLLEELAAKGQLLPVCETIREAWPDQRGAYKRLYLQVVARLLQNHDRPTVVSKLRRFLPSALDREALKYQDRPGIQLRSYLKALE